MSKLPIFERFLSVGNLKPKLEWFFKPKLKPKIFLLNWVPAHVAEGGELGEGGGVEAGDEGPVEGLSARRDARLLSHLAALAGVSLGAEALDAAARRHGREARSAVQAGTGTIS